MTLDPLPSSLDSWLVEASITNLDGTPIENELWDPLRGRRRLVLAVLVVLVAELAIRTPFLAELVVVLGWSTVASWQAPLIIAGMCALLTPVAIVARTPDAWMSHRVLLVAGLLVAGSELVSGLAADIWPLGTWLLGRDADTLERLRAITAAASAAQMLAGIAASLAVAFALARARTRTVPGRGRAVLVVVLVLFAVAEVGQVAAPLSVSGGGPGLPMTTILLLVASAAAAFVRTAVTLAGWFAGEAPRRAWSLAAAGTLLSFLLLVLIATVGLLGAMLTPVTTPVFLALSSASAVVSVLTLAAFADGLGTRHAVVEGALG